MAHLSETLWHRLLELGGAIMSQGRGPTPEAMAAGEGQQGTLRA